MQHIAIRRVEQLNVGLSLLDGHIGRSLNRFTCYDSSKGRFSRWLILGLMTVRDDERCCGSGTCIIDLAGRCWCGQQWDGEKMVSSQLPSSSSASESLSDNANPSSTSSADVQG